VPGAQQSEQVSQYRLPRQPSGPSQSSSSGKKRDREEDDEREHVNHPTEMPPPPLPRERLKKPMKAVQRVDANDSFSREASRSRSVSSSSAIRMGSVARALPSSLPPPSLPPPDLAHFQSDALEQDLEPLFLPSQQPSLDIDGVPAKKTDAEPLFLPGSQLSRSEEELLVATGLGLENMTAHELEAMLDEDAGEEIPPSQAPRGTAHATDNTGRGVKGASKIAGDSTAISIVSSNNSGMSQVKNEKAGGSRSDSLSFFDDVDYEEDMILAPTQNPSFNSDSSKVRTVS
jgi:hypothetical protein